MEGDSIVLYFRLEIFEVWRSYIEVILVKVIFSRGEKVYSEVLRVY